MAFNKEVLITGTMLILEIVTEQRLKERKETQVEFKYLFVISTQLQVYIDYHIILKTSL